MWIVKIGIVFYGKGSNDYNIDGTIHAEVAAINSLKYQIKKKKIDIIVFRTNKTASSILWSKPCSNCIKSIYNTIYNKNYKLRRLYYINSDGNVEYYTPGNLPIY